MLNFKYAFSGLSKKISFTLIAIIQLSVSFMFLYNVIYIKDQVSSTVNKTTLTFNKNNVYVFEPASNMDEMMNRKDSNFGKFYNYLKENTNIVHSTVYESHILLEKFNGFQKFLLTTNYAPIKEGVQYFPIKALKVDYNYIMTFPYKVTSGKTLTKEDFSESRTETPVILGSSYKKIYKLNDIINYYDYVDGKKTLKVKGFIDDGYNFIGRPINHLNVHSLDAYIIFPLKDQRVFNEKDEDQKSLISNNIMQSFIIINSKNKLQTIDDIKNTSEKYFGSINVKSIDDELLQYKDTYKIEQTIVTTIFLIVFIMCSIGIIANTMNSIETRHSEFGIHLLNGASMKDIYLRIIFELLLIFSISTILSFFGISILKTLNFVQFNLSCIVQLLIIISLLSVVILIYPTIIIKRASINTLLRRN